MALTVFYVCEFIHIPNMRFCVCLSAFLCVYQMILRSKLTQGSSPAVAFDC